MSFCRSVIKYKRKLHALGVLLISIQATKQHLMSTFIGFQIRILPMTNNCIKKLEMHLESDKGKRERFLLYKNKYVLVHITLPILLCQSIIFCRQKLPTLLRQFHCTNPALPILPCRFYPACIAMLVRYDWHGKIGRVGLVRQN